MFNVFPQGLEGTLVIPIVVGVLTMALFTEVWGWDFVGVVVPGYLASVWLLEPVVAAVVVAEAVATWALAVGMDRLLTASRATFPVFGRDRFFLVLASSVVVRIVLEGFVLQALVTRLSVHYPGLEARRHELFGIGLVLVPLTANRLWGPGVFRGLFQIGVQGTIVALVLKLVLLPLTNFSLAGFDPTYDPLALAFLSSPRAQMALLVTASVASFWNRKYGWDYHGILVPALLGLAVLSPVKLGATILEAIGILLVSRGLMALPRLRRLNIEGPRRLVLCFCVGVAFKMLSARMTLLHLPGYRPTDLLGFGYVLPSLLAERVWLKSNAALVFLPTLQTSVVGFTLTAVAAVALAAVAPVEQKPLFFQTLPQAVAALAPPLKTATEPFGGLLTDRSRGPVAITADGYRVFADSRSLGLVALTPATKKVLIAPIDEWMGIAAAGAVHRGLALAYGDAAAASVSLRKLGFEPEVLPPPVTTASVVKTPRGWVELAYKTAADASRPDRPVEESSPSLAPAAALHIDRNRDSAASLVRAVTPYGLKVTATADEALVLEGSGWPMIILRPGATSVVTSSYASEWGTAGATVLACEAMTADCVIARDDGGTAMPLATALAERRGRSLVVVRGTLRPLGADVLVLTSPEPKLDELPVWLVPLVESIKGRLTVTRVAGQDLAPLRAFPAGAARLSPTALLWLSPFARRIMGGADQIWWSRPDVLELVKRRGLTVLHVDGVGWLGAGRGAPSAAALERAEVLARTSDVAQLSSHVADARLALVLDDARGLAALAVEQGTRRALVLGGDRREERAVIGGVGAVEGALRRGVRTLLSSEATP